MTAMRLQLLEKIFRIKLKKIQERYQEIIDGLDLDFSLKDDFKIIEGEFPQRGRNGLCRIPWRVPERKSYGSIS